MQNGAPGTPAPDPAAKAPETKSMPVPDLPLTSADDDASAKRPRDARLLHVILHNLGVQSYQERVPLQLLDFAYRYTSSVLSDALRLSAEGYSGQSNEKRRGPGAAAPGANDDSSGITVTALRQAIASRQGSAFEPALPKEFMLEQAADRNRVALPKVPRVLGVQLPEEKYCLTGVGWGLKEDWDDIPDDDEVPIVNGNGQAKALEQQDHQMGGLDGAEDGVEDEDGAAKMEDVFGEAEADEDMTDS